VFTSHITAQLPQFNASGSYESLDLATFYGGTGFVRLLSDATFYAEHHCQFWAELGWIVRVKIALAVGVPVGALLLGAAILIVFGRAAAARQRAQLDTVRAALLDDGVSMPSSAS
jgi:hypothetical protein